MLKMPVVHVSAKINYCAKIQKYDSIYNKYTRIIRKHYTKLTSTISTRPLAR